MKTKLFLFLILFCSLSCFAQREANVWHFGEGYSLNFNSGVAVQGTGSAMQTVEGCASYCDYQGNLLFYSNGGGRVPSSGQNTGQIWNKNNGVMYDMQGLQGGGFSAAQSSVIVPAPGEPNVYYLFTIDEVEHYIDATPAILAAQPNGRGFRYFKIDMNLNGGLGAVIQADVQLYDYSLEGLCAIRHANETDYWILINQDTSGIGVYKVTPSGVTFHNLYPCTTSGIIKASPNSVFAGAPCCNRVYCAAGVLEFDISTGVLSNPSALGGAVFSAEFSHNGFYLYTSEFDPVNSSFSLCRYDVSAAFQTAQPLVSTREEIIPGLLAYYMQLAPDGKIYFIQSNNSPTLGTISCSNSLTPEITTDVFTFGSTATPFYSLPNFPSWIFYNPYEDYMDFGPDTIFLCPGDSFVLDQGPGTFWEWGGDCYSGPPSTWPDNSTRTFTVTQPGTYSGTVTGFCPSPGASDQITVLPCNINPDPCGNFFTEDSLQVCVEDTIQLQLNTSALPPGAQIRWLGGNGVFVPSDTIPQPGYIPTPAELAQGSLSLRVEVSYNNSPGTGSGRLLAYDHGSQDLVFAISPIDGSVDTVQENGGLDWLAMGYESSSSILYGKSIFSGLTSLNTLNGDTNIIQPNYFELFYAGEFDNIHEKYYMIGMYQIAAGGGPPWDQFLAVVNTSTGNFSPIGDLSLLTTNAGYYSTDDGINGLAYDPGQDVLYGVTQNGKLYRINVNTGAPTLVGNTQADLRGLAYDAATNKLWGISVSATLYEINKNTGAVVSTVNCQVPFSTITSLTYAPAATTTCLDSVIVKFGSSVSSNTTASACSSYTWNGNTYTSSGSYNVLFENGSATGCDSTAFLTLTISGLPTANATSTSATCNLANGTATATALGGSGSYTYNWSNGFIGNLNSGLAEGSYTVTATDQNGCSAQAQVSVGSIPVADILVTASDTVIEYGDSVRINVLYGADYRWTPETGLSCNNCSTPIAKPLKNTTYFVTGKDTNGCAYSRSVTIVVEIICNELFVPDIFSPNGRGDVNNEKLCVYSNCVKEMTFAIYNRWGELIYLTNDIRGCWDGTHKGIEAATGTYVYRLYVEQLDGQKIERAGNITLVR